MSNPIRKLAMFSGKVCSTMCEPPECEKKQHAETRCCHKLFCELTRRNLPEGVSYEATGHEIPFMGPKGCIVKPEHRPVCSAFLCHGIAEKSPGTWKKYQKMCERAGLPANKVC